MTVTGERVALSLEQAYALLGAARGADDVLCVQFGRHFESYYLRMPNGYQSALGQMRAGRPGALRGEEFHAGRSVPSVAVL